MSTLPLPPSHPPSPNEPGGVFDDYPVDRKSCQLLGPTALVWFISFWPTMTYHSNTMSLGRAGRDGCARYLLPSLQET